MGKLITEIAQEIKTSDKKVQLIYAFNGTGKTRLSREFKTLVQPDTEDSSEMRTRNKIIYYNAFTEDLFYWDNDLLNDSEVKLKIQQNTFIDWVIIEQGQDQNIISNFQHYTDEKLTPVFNLQDSEITFSFLRGNDEVPENVKISKGEESNFIWSIFYSLIESVIGVLNIPDPSDRDTEDFNDLDYIFIDDPVSSLDENHLIEVAVDIANLIKSSKSNLKFVMTTHNPLFYNVLHNELSNAEKYQLEKFEDSTYNLKKQLDDSPFSYHLFLKKELEKAIETNDIKKYHFNFLRNLLEKTSTFLGYDTWQALLPKDNENSSELYEKRIVNISSHSKHSGEEYSEISEPEKAVLKLIFDKVIESHKFST